MERIKSFLYEYPWLLKSGIWVILVLWGMQLDYVLVEAYKTEVNRPPRNVELEQKLNHGIYLLSQRQLAEAKAKGGFYGPQDYFDDYKEIKQLKYALGIEYDYDPPFFMSTLLELQSISLGNVGKGKRYSQGDVSTAAGKFSDWLKSGGSAGDDFQEQIDDLSWKERASIFFKWAFKFYLKGFFLVFLLYLIRMTERKGILEIILADKKRFVFSIILWPFFLMKYPSNVVKEIIVEAELRRMGNLFRKFTLEEKELVRRVTESANFWSWIFNFHSENRDNFQRSLVVALAVTILVNLVPFQVQAGDFDQCELTRDGPEIVSAVSIANIDTIDKQEICDCFKGIVLFDDFLKLRANLLVVISFFRLRIFWAKEFFQKIDHVPIGGCLFAEVVLWESK